MIITDDETLRAVLDPVLPGKVFSPIAPAGTAEPYVIFQDLFAQPENSMCGFASLDQVHYQIDTYAITKREAKALMSAVKAALRLTTFPPNVENEQGFYEPDSRLSRRMIQIIVWVQPEKVTA